MKSILIFFHAVFIVLAGVVTYTTIIPSMINYVLFHLVIPIVLIIIILFFICKKHDSSKIKIAAILYIVFSALSYLCIVIMDKVIGSGFENLAKNYYILSLSGVFIIIAFINLIKFFSLINDEKYQSKLNNNANQDSNQNSQNQNQIVDNQVNSEEYNNKSTQI